MREVQGRLTSTPIPIVVLAREVYAVSEPTRAQIESVRRAVKRLVELGQAERPTPRQTWIAWMRLPVDERRTLRNHRAWVRTPEISVGSCPGAGTKPTLTDREQSQSVA